MYICKEMWSHIPYRFWILNLVLAAFFQELGSGVGAHARLQRIHVLCLRLVYGADATAAAVSGASDCPAVILPLLAFMHL